jgi:hypothetical protein
METDYYTDDGHYMDIEELTQRIRFKIIELKEQNHSDDEIIEFEENEAWHKIARNIIDASKEHETNLQND